MEDLVITTKADNHTMQRSLLVFENAIKSEETKKQYLYQLEKLRRWTGIKDYDSLLEGPDNKIQILLEDYLFHLKKTLSPKYDSTTKIRIKTIQNGNEFWQLP